jgi:hypothetical protein
MEEKEKKYTSRHLFKIVNNELADQAGSYYRGDHRYKRKKGVPRTIFFDRVGISLCLINGNPELNVPKGQKAWLEPCQFNNGTPAPNFVDVRIQ